MGDGYWLVVRRPTIDCGNAAPSLLESSSSPLSPVATPVSLGSALLYIPLNPAVEPPMSLTRELNKKQSRSGSWWRVVPLRWP